MAKRRKNIVVEEQSQRVLNEIRDAERSVFWKFQPLALQELEKRGSKHEGPTGNYNEAFYAEAPERELSLKMGNSSPHAHLLEFGSGPRVTQSGESRGSMPKFAVIRKSALALRRKVFDAVEEALRRV